MFVILAYNVTFEMNVLGKIPMLYSVGIFVFTVLCVKVSEIRYCLIRIL